MRLSCAKLSIPSGVSIEALEVAILELIENIPSDETMGRSLLMEFCKYVGRIRRTKQMFRAEIILIDSDL